ncbi:MAG: hypothetical protein AAF901_10160 [Bacteroidota bacterium]
MYNKFKTVKAMLTKFLHTIPFKRKALLTVTIISFIFFSFSWFDMRGELADLRDKFDLAQEKIVQLSETLKMQRARISQLNQELEEKNQELDSIRQMLVLAKEKNIDYEKQLAKMRNRLRNYSREVNALESKLMKSASNHSIQDSMINKYQKDFEKAQIKEQEFKSQITSLVKSREKAKDKVEQLVNLLDKAEKEKVATADSLKQVEREEDIVLYSEVSVLSIRYLHSNGKPIRKDKHLAGSWTKTGFGLKLDHPEGLLQPGMEFAIQLVDITEGKFLPVNEGSNEGNSEALYIKLGDDMSLVGTFSQYDQRKSSKNYRFQVSYVTSSGQLLPLKAGKIRLISNKQRTHRS